MKLNIKKTGLILAASSAFLASNALANNHGAEVYGKIGIEFAQTDTTAYASAAGTGTKTSTSTTGFRDGGDRIGVKGTKDNLTGHLEFSLNGVSGGGASIRYANVAVALENGGSLTIGRQNNIVRMVNLGWTSNAWNNHASALDSYYDARVSGSRYSGVSYKQTAGQVSFGVMVGSQIKGYTTTDAAGNAKTKEVAPVDNMGLAVNFKANEMITVGVAYDQRAKQTKNGLNTVDANGNQVNNAQHTSIIAAVTYTQGPIGVTLNYNTIDLGKASTATGSNKTRTQDAIAVNATFDAGMATPFVGVRQSNYKDGKSTNLTKYTEMATSIGANFSVLGGSAFVAIDSINNAGGNKKATLNELHSGIFYSF